MTPLLENEKVEKALQFVAQNGWQREKEFFPGLVRMLATLLNCDYALVSKVLDAPDKTAETLAFYAHGVIAENVRYSLTGTPCEHVHGQSLCVYSHDIRTRFPSDSLLVQMQAESYAGVPLWNSKGTPIGIIAVMHGTPFEETSLIKTVLQIVAVRAAAEMERKLHEKEIVRREEKFRNLFEYAGDAIYLIDPTTTEIVDANQMAGKMLGYSKTQFQNMTINDIDGNSSLTASTRWAQNFLQKNTAQQFERTHIAQDGSRIAVEINASPVRIDNKQLIQAYVRDIRPRKQLEAELIQSQKMQAVGTLAGGIAHDFNNILMSISGFAELGLLESAEEKTRDTLKSIYAASQRAHKLVSQILAFSRKTPQQQEILSLSKVVNDGISILRASFPPPTMFEVQIENESIHVLGDLTQLEQVIMNICTNAAHALNHQRGDIKLQLTTEELGESEAETIGLTSGGHACLQISDNGSGIADDILPRIFEPFFTTKEQGKGTGLGLSMAHGIVKSHSGAITVKSKLKKGSTFTVWLPLASDSAVKKAAEPSLPKIEAGKGQILVIDDEPQVLRILKTALEDFGYQPSDYSDPVKAFEKFKSQPQAFIAVITDEAMPVMRGAEVIQRIRRIRKDVPIFVCTGYIDMETADVNSDRVYYLQKPFSLSKLSEMLSKHLTPATRQPMGAEKHNA